MSTKGAVETGRTLPRARHVCPSCQQRQAVGQPRAGEGTWPARLHIEPEMMDLLLVAAAEFVELCQEAGEYEDAIAFLDWVRPDAVTAAWNSPIKVEPHPVSLAEKQRRHRAGAA